MLMLPLADMIAASVLLFYPRAQYQPGTAWTQPTELPKYRGGVCRVASCVFKTACIEEHFRGYSHASLAEMLAASALLFFWQGQYERDNVDRALNVEVVLGRGEFQGLSMSILNASTSLHTTVCRTFGSIHRTFGSIRRIISDELWLHLPCRTFGSICRTFAPYMPHFLAPSAVYTPSAKLLVHLSLYVLKVNLHLPNFWCICRTLIAPFWTFGPTAELLPHYIKGAAPAQELLWA